MRVTKEKYSMRNLKADKINVAKNLNDSQMVRYSNVWEDYFHSFKILDKYKFNSVLMIGSGGENAFNILAKSAVNITAIDANYKQIELIKIKIEAIRKLSREQYISFMGLSDAFAREELVALLSDEIKNKELILDIVKDGALFVGKLERYFKKWTKCIEDKYNDFNQGFYLDKDLLKNTVSRSEFKQDFYSYFNQQSLGEGGRDKSMYHDVNFDSAEFFWGKYLEAVEKYSNGKSAYFELFNFSKISKSEFPYYLKNDDNFNRLKNNLHKLTLEVGFVEDASNEKQYDLAILSNIFEYLDDSKAKNLLEHLDKTMSSVSGLLYWNLLKPKAACDLNESWVYQKELSETMSENDLSWYYQDVRFEMKGAN